MRIGLKDEKCYRCSTSWLHFLAGKIQATLSPPLPSHFQSSSTSLFCLWPARLQSHHRNYGLPRKCRSSDGSRVGFPPSSSLSGGAGSRGWCWAVLYKSGQSVTVTGRGGSRGDAEFAQSPGCTVRFTQLCCSQCKYGQPHSSPASLPQHTSRAEG